MAKLKTVVKPPLSAQTIMLCHEAMQGGASVEDVIGALRVTTLYFERKLKWVEIDAERWDKEGMDAMAKEA